MEFADLQRLMASWLLDSMQVIYVFDKEKPGDKGPWEGSLVVNTEMIAAIIYCTRLGETNSGAQPLFGFPVSRLPFPLHAVLWGLQQPQPSSRWDQGPEDVGHAQRLRWQDRWVPGQLDTPSIWGSLEQAEGRLPSWWGQNIPPVDSWLTTYIELPCPDVQPKSRILSVYLWIVSTRRT